MANTSFDLRKHSLVFMLLSLLWLILLSTSADSQTPSTSPPVEIKVTAKQFEFNPRTITLQKGKPVRLIITSEDVDHGFKLDAFGINQRIPAKKTVNVDFTPDKVGRFEFQCSITCGSGHDDMMGRGRRRGTVAAESGCDL